MNHHDLEAGFASIYPLSRAAIAALPLDEAERELGAAILAEPVPTPAAADGQAVRRARHPRRRRLYAGGVGLVAAALAAWFLLVGPGARTEKTAPAFDTSLVQVAKTSPLVLLEEPGWRVGADTRVAANRGEMHFIRRGSSTAGSGERAELRWRSGPAAARLRKRFERRVPYVVYVLPPVLDTRVLQIHASGPSGRKRFAAVWEDHGRVLVFRSTAPSFTAFERRLGALHRVGPIAWLTALPEELTRCGMAPRC
jgi:hypothetical protein